MFTLNRTKHLKILTFTLLLASLAACSSGGSGEEGNVESDFQTKAGCYLSAYGGYGQSQYKCGLLPSFGDPNLDRVFTEEVAIQQRFFQDSASVYVLNECDESQANAYSSPENFILFGYYLVQKIRRNYNDDIPIAVVLAHEYGHQLQFTFGWQSENTNTSVNTELDADAWAGFYLILNKSYLPRSSLSAALDQVVSIGDYQFNSPTHHGTPYQRGAMFVVGFQVGVEWARARQLNPSNPPTVVDIHDRFNQYKRTILSVLPGLEAGPMINKANTLSDQPIDGETVQLLSKIVAGKASHRDFKFNGFVPSFKSTVVLPAGRRNYPE